jgi:MarR family transcriptional regulator, organic hydroperoxide resistance regulator
MSRAEAAGLAAVLVRAGLAVGRFHRRAAGTHGLTSTAMGVLAELSGSAGVSHRELAARLGVAPATLTPVVDLLDAAGDLTRDRDRADRRVVRLSITEPGRARIAAASAAVEEAVARRMPPVEPEHAMVIREHLLAVLAAFDDVTEDRWG